jgi:hypothetical protein
VESAAPAPPSHRGCYREAFTDFSNCHPSLPTSGQFFFKVKSSPNTNSGDRSTFECAIKTIISATISAAYFCAISRPIGQFIASIGILVISSPSISSSSQCISSCLKAPRRASYSAHLDILDGSSTLD